jgi:hypothetical protein
MQNSIGKAGLFRDKATETKVDFQVQMAGK